MGKKSPCILLMLVLMFCSALYAEDSARKLKQQVNPIYPEMARNMNLSGTVRLQVTITSQGNVKEAKVLGGHPLLADAALRAVERWKYEPGQEEVRTVTIDFKR